jgi:glycerol dehydrogenase-like iron-containing ADH family enzyme
MCWSHHHKFASSLSGDTRDVNFDFGHVETQFHVLSKPLAHLNQHLESCLEGGIDVQIVGETDPASITMAGEHATHDGVLRQTITHHLPADGRLIGVFFLVQLVPRN